MASNLSVATPLSSPKAGYHANEKGGPRAALKSDYGQDQRVMVTEGATVTTGAGVEVT